MTMQEFKQRAGGMVSFVDDLNGAIRENPVAAGLVGMGLLWMFFGSSRLAVVASVLPSAAKTITGAIGSAAASAGDAVGHSVGDAAGRVNEHGRQAADAISSRIGVVATTVKDEASAVYNAVKSNGESAIATVVPSVKVTGRPGELTKRVGSVMQENLTKTLQTQPLLLGVIGVAIGAGIASAFPSTQTERDMMGEAGAAVKDKIQVITSATSERAKDVLAGVKNEAELQGLTPASAKESAQSVIQKVRTVGDASADSFKARIS